MSAAKKPADLVNPYIGSISHLLKSTLPEVLVPYSYIRACPRVGESNDSYSNDLIYCFQLGMAGIMPGRSGDFRNTYDHAREKVRCYQSDFRLEKYGIRVESAVTRHAHLYRFHNAPEVRLSGPEGSEIAIDGDTARIHVPVRDEGRDLPGEFIVLKANRPFQLAQPGAAASSTSTARIAAWESPAAPPPVAVTLAIDPAVATEFYAAVSYISYDKAEESLRREVTDFDAAVAGAYQIWNDLLGRFQVEGNTEDRRIVFYTALYRVFRRMVDFGEYGRYFSGFDQKIHDGDHFYTIDPLWDTFRTPHPLRMLAAREDEEQMLQSYVDMYKQSGIMSSFTGKFSERPAMIGFHAAALFADAYAKGLKADYETAYEGIRKNAMEQGMLPHTSSKLRHTALEKCYLEKGYYPALKKDEVETTPNVNKFERRQSVSVTLEHAYDDWCTAKLARALGKEEDAAYFARRGENWRNLYHEGFGLFAPKDIDGDWFEGFDPMLGGGQGGRAWYAENNGYTWAWSVPHNIEGLIEIMGGPEQAERKLDELFRMNCGPTSKYVYMGQFPDSTGLMGQFAMGNEPSFHIPYLYNYTGHAWKTQKRVRELMNVWYINSPIGICGDEDEGTLSGWLVFSALGFFPTCPGSPRYAIGSPLFDRASLDVGGGKRFTVISAGAGDGLRYIQSAKLNGKPLAAPFLDHSEIAAGGELVLVMGGEPVEVWGA
ncbi:MAG: GH92 family glycosyl hydrolase [Clostridiales bacterium]|jgi:predicted alpha-1,2-mannosidase|nr:GH92 family glycosyl hydrolase [Clostridiales bacterium]